MLVQTGCNDLNAGGSPGSCYHAYPHLLPHHPPPDAGSTCLLLGLCCRIPLQLRQGISKDHNQAADLTHEQSTSLTGPGSGEGVDK